MNSVQPILINFDNFQDYLKFSDPNEGNSLNIADASEDNFIRFDKEHMVWLVHRLEDLHLIKRIKESSILVFVANLDEFSLADHILPGEIFNYFKESRIFIIAGGDPSDQSKIVGDLIDIEQYDGWEPIISDGFAEPDLEYLQKFYRSLASKINMKSLYKATSIQTSHVFLRNALINAPLANRYIEIAKFKNSQIDRPVLVVAAGPSLNKQMPILAQYQKYFTILAVDTVWPILDRHGVIPDMVFALDSRSKPSWSRNGVSDKTLFAVDIGCAPRLVWSHDRNHVFTSTSVAITQLLYRLGAMVDVVSTGGSVATSAFNFARLMGAKPIVLIGQDLALTGGKDHADGYLHAYSDATLKKRSETGFDTDGYYGDRVKTEKQLLFYKTWYEMQIKAQPDIMVINSTEGGARIQGCLQIPFKDVCSELDRSSFFKNFNFSGEVLSFDLGHLNNLIENLDKLIKKTLDYIELSRKGERLIKRSGPRSQTKLFRQIDRINDELTNSDNDARTVLDAFSQASMEKIRHETVTDKDEKSLDKALEKYLQIYKGIQDSGDQGVVMLQQVRRLYESLKVRGTYDPDLLDEILGDKMLPPV